MPEDAAMFFGGSNSTGKIQSNIVQGGPERGYVFDSSLYGQGPNTALTFTSNVAQSFPGNGIEANTNSLTNSQLLANISQVTGSSGLLLQTGNTGNNFLANIFRGSTWGCQVLGTSVAGNSWNGSTNIGKPMNTPGTCRP